MCQYTINPYRQSAPLSDDFISAAFAGADILAVHKSLPEYQPTPLLSLPALAYQLGVRQILVKDESWRFGLKAFKALGASYAVYRFLRSHFKSQGKAPPAAENFYNRTDTIAPKLFTFCTATDGNHGRGVAWVARKLKQCAVVYMPQNSVPTRIEAIKAESATVNIVNGTYDDAVLECARDAEKNGWQVISDTSWSGYTEIPRWIMAGYTTMFREIHEVQKPETDVDIVFIQAGVGALAAAAAWYYNKIPFSTKVKLVSVEPISADCLLQSIRSPHGNPRSSQGRQDSIMAGLNCGTPSLIAWPLVKAGFDLFMTISDKQCIKAMNVYYNSLKNDTSVISGESGAAGLAALLTLCEQESMAPARKKLNLNRNSTILLLNTEGDTDPEMFNKLVG